MRAPVVGKNISQEFPPLLFGARPEEMRAATVSDEAGVFHPALDLSYPPETIGNVLLIVQEMERLGSSPQAFWDLEVDDLVDETAPNVAKVTIRFQVKGASKEFTYQVFGAEFVDQVQAQFGPWGFTVQTVMTAKAEFELTQFAHILLLYKKQRLLYLRLFKDGEDKPLWQTRVATLEYGLPAKVS